jgi:hypoxanthine phosphoribosyltransferase
MNFLEELKVVQETATCLYSQKEIELGINNLAASMTVDLHNRNPIFICIMNGGLHFSAQLTQRFNFPLQIDYLHLSRYEGDLAGSEITWYAKPQCELQNRTVVLLDDIFDIGISLEAAKTFCLTQGAREVISAVLLKKKLHPDKQIGKANYFVFECPDVYVFGYGMDYKNYLRNLNAIYALK